MNYRYEEQALKVIAQAAAGGMRDALSLLDQVVSFSGEKLQLENALLVTGSVSQDVFYDIVIALKRKRCSTSIIVSRRVNCRWERATSFSRRFNYIFP